MQKEFCKSNDGNPLNRVFKVDERAVLPIFEQNGDRN